VIGEYKPDVLIMIVLQTKSEGENETIALARKLRAGTVTYSLPIVFACDEDERTLRAAAQYIGADDYFQLSTPTAEILARLDSLFWRIEADRRAAPVVTDRRIEIDNFMFMLDSVREDLRAGAGGTLALIYAIPAGDEIFDKVARDRTLSEAHGFLKLNLRRVDAVTFYGPTTLLVYLPRMDARIGVAALSRLHREFREEHPGCDVVAGMASFPEHGGDVESLIERAEEAVNVARTSAAGKRVIAYEAKKVEPVVAVAPDVSQEVAREAKREDEPEEHRATVSTVMSEAQSDGAEADYNAAANEAAARERERRAAGAVLPRRLLLTISDAARMAQINSLIRAAGYEARAAFNGQQALDLLRIERPDLLLLDYELQGIDGLETIRRLRKQSGGRLPVPVVVLLPKGNERARLEALELGALSVLMTPYDPAELLGSIRAAGSVD
jgi:DNA-binding response OmpR family regulator